MYQKTLAEGLNLRGGENDYLIFHDVNSGLDFIRPSRNLLENGFYVELGAYKCHAFIDFREVPDEDGKWKAVSESLNGAGYWAIQARWDELFAPKLVAEMPEAPAETPKKVRKPTKKKTASEKKPVVNPKKTPVKTKLKKAKKE